MSRIPVLMYHRVDDRQAGDDALTVSPQQFSAHLDWLAENGYAPCRIADFDAWHMSGKTLPERSVLITFDDGYMGLHEHALPALATRGWPATVFLVSGLIGRHDGWRRSEPGARNAERLLDRPRIQEMTAHGLEFHSHSRNHADLTTLDSEHLLQEVQGSRADLEDMLGRSVDYFAYPYGRFDERVQRAVTAAGYRLAFSVRSGFNHPGADRLAIRRLDIAAGDSRTQFGRKLSLGTNDGSLLAGARYLADRLKARLTTR